MSFNNSHSLQALIFDVDGTLADTERDGHRVAFNRAFQAAGLEDVEWSIELYSQLLSVTGGKERLRHYFQTMERERKFSDLDQTVKELHRLKTGYYKEIVMSGSIALRPGVKRLIEEARAAQVRLAIATTTTLENVTTLLKSSLDPSALDWFEVIAAGDMVPKKKPAPDIFEYALNHLSLEPSNCLAFEDSGHGLTSALTAGIPTLITVTDYTQNQNFTGAIAVLNNLGEPQQPCRIIQGQLPPNSSSVCLSTCEQILSSVAAR
ncbi:MAG: HAD-IA family hydrolase [Cyanobacteria bacterium P01_H01_bin.15]